MTKDIEMKAIDELIYEVEMFEQAGVYPVQDFIDNLKVLAAKVKEETKLEGCVVVPIKCPDPDFADLLFDELGKKAIGTFGEDMLIHFSDINEEKIWDLMLEAARGGNHD